MTTPYCFVDYLKMQPGTILSGLVRPGNSWKFAPEWVLPEGMESWKTVKTSPFLEHRVRWRQHLRKHSRMIGKSRVYRPPVEMIRSCQEENRVILLKLPVGFPIGIYLGHIIRCDGVSLVNVLTSEGYDVWL